MHVFNFCFIFLDDFHARKLSPNEILPVFFHELRQLLKQAMPEASEDTRKQLILHQFVSGLPAACLIDQGNVLL